MDGVDRGGGMVKGGVDEGSVVGSQGEGRVVDWGVVGEGSSSVDESLGVTEGRSVMHGSMMGSGMVGLSDVGLGLTLVLHVSNESVL